MFRKEMRNSESIRFYTVSRFIVVMVSVIVCVSTMAQTIRTADDVLSKVAVAFRNGGGVAASFSVLGGEVAGSGNMKASGNKFAIVMKEAPSTWYDGKTMATYDPKHKEVTYSYPDVSEINSINPYSLVCGYKNIFNARLVASKNKSVYCILLTPKNGKSEMKKVLLYIDRKTLRPVKMIVTSSKQGPVTIQISNYRTGIKFRTTDFVFPSKSYRGVRVNDMR